MSRKEELFSQLDALGLPRGSYAIFAGGPMSVIGLKPFNDLDLIVTSEIFEAFLDKSGWTLETDHGEILQRENISMVRKWEMGGWDDEKLISDAQIIDGHPYVRLEEVLKWKKHRRLPKDLIDIELLENHLQQINSRQGEN